jgi:hypothetical protein
MKLDVTGRDARVGVVAWRRTQLAQAGFPLPLASRAARDPGFDVHALLELVERGCDPGLALRVVAPLDGGGEAA